MKFWLLLGWRGDSQVVTGGLPCVEISCQLLITMMSSPIHTHTYKQLEMPGENSLSYTTKSDGRDNQHIPGQTSSPLAQTQKKGGADDYVKT